MYFFRFFFLTLPYKYDFIMVIMVEMVVMVEIIMVEMIIMVVTFIMVGMVIMVEMVILIGILVVMTFKLDFPGNLCGAAFAILAMFFLFSLFLHFFSSVFAF